MSLFTIASTKTHKVQSAKLPTVEKTLNTQKLLKELNDDEYELYLEAETFDPKEAKSKKQKSVKIKRKKKDLEELGDVEINQFSTLASFFVDEGILTQARFDEIVDKYKGFSVGEFKQIGKILILNELATKEEIDGYIKSGRTLNQTLVDEIVLLGQQRKAIAI